MRGIDTLALPAVPPAAVDDHPIRDRVIALLFIVALSLPALMLVKTARRDTLAFELRQAAPWPSLSSPREFATRFEKAFGDRFGGRDSLLALHHAVMADVFRVSPAPNVMLGSNNWLYFLGEDGKSLDRNYRGRLPVDDAQIDAVVRELRRRAEFVASRGAVYVATIVPEKYTIYPEHLPGWAARRMERTPLDRLVDGLRADGSVRFVDLRGPLRAAKGTEPLYYTSDSHWNFVGATVGYREIMTEVQRALPAGRMPQIAEPFRPPYVAGVDVYRGDLDRMVGYRPRFAEPDYAPFAKVLGDPSSRCGRRTDDAKEPSVEIYECARPNLLRALVYRDSMSIPLIPLLSENFGRVVYVESRLLDPALVVREKPDVVIEEIVERAMFGPVASPMPEVTR